MATLKQAKASISLVSYIETHNTRCRAKKVSDNQIRINPCPVCGHKDHFTIYTGNDFDTYVSFSGCCKGGDILNYMQEVEGLSFEEAKRNLFVETGLTEEKNFDLTIRKGLQVTSKELETDYTKFCKEHLKPGDERIKNYLTKRHIETSLGDKYEMFINADNGNEYITIPIKNEKQDKVIAYVGRNISKGEQRYKNSKGTMHIFNMHYLFEEAKENECIYICEGIFDALSIEQTGLKAIALNSTSNITKLIEKIKEAKEKAKGYKYIIALDNDKAGIEGAKKLESELISLEFACSRLAFPGGIDGNEIKDVNQILEQYTLENFSDFIKQEVNEYEQKSVLEYIARNFIEDIENTKRFANKDTGFKILNEKLNGGIRPGLYLIGAIPSLGKTTFSLQLANNLAEKGEKVIVFSLEQSRFELVAKDISRINYKIKPGETLKALDIMQGKRFYESTIEALDFYTNNIAPNLIIEEGNFNVNVDTIKDYIKGYISKTKNRPVVFIDYLQIIRPTKEIEKLSDKQQMDHIATTLKRISREYNIPIICISSFNRQNYNTRVSFEAFKETGGLEYTADVLLALQLKAVAEITDKSKTIDLAEAKTKFPREVQLVCLKNRFGVSNFSINYDFYCPFNYFAEKEESK